MNKEIIKTIYLYEDVEIPSGAMVSAQEVETRDGRVTSIIAGVILYDNKRITFSVYGENDITFSMQNVPSTVDASTMIKEFINYVEADLR